VLTLCVLSTVPGCHAQFELRYNEVDRARAVFERYVEVLPSVKAWVRYAKFELQHNDVSLARSCYERAMEALGEDSHTVRQIRFPVF
jgi:crooked neck